ncbi:uncharacterized protein [Musca autumnalis]|uniref:uncharacterized protein n=1 Tax=Musca autumnalis TaxID=221902 RepID=UPI003CF81C8B
MKSCILCGVIVLLACVTLALSHGQDWGRHIPGDHLLYRHNFGVPPKRNEAQTQWTTFPSSHHKMKGFRITAIHVIDNFKNQTGFIPVLTSGGPGKSFATVEYHGYYGKGFQGAILIYGK